MNGVFKYKKITAARRQRSSSSFKALFKKEIKQRALLLFREGKDGEKRVMKVEENKQGNHSFIVFPNRAESHLSSWLLKALKITAISYQLSLSIVQLEF